MMTVADIHNVTFEKAVRGYRPEDVDSFLTQVAQEFDALTNAVAEAQQEKETALAGLHKEKEDAEKKIYILAEKIEEYRKDEDNLKIALLNAQRLGESVVNEARQKAEAIVSDAKTRGKQAERQMKDAVRTEEKRLSYMQAEVARFKGSILGLYKQHIEALSSLPVPEEHKEAARQAQAAYAVAPSAADVHNEVSQPEALQENAVSDLIVVAENAPEKRAAVQPYTEPEPMSFALLSDANTFDSPGAESFEEYQGISFQKG